MMQLSLGDRRKSVCGAPASCLKGSLNVLATHAVCNGLSTLSQKSATVAEFGDCRRCLAVFCDSRTFLWQRGQGLRQLHAYCRVELLLPIQYSVSRTSASPDRLASVLILIFFIQTSFSALCLIQFLIEYKVMPSLICRAYGFNSP